MPGPKQAIVYLSAPAAMAKMPAPEPIAKSAPALRPAISVAGLGYAGSVSMGCLAHLGFRMIGVDTSERHVDAINRGASPVLEARLDEMLREGAARGLVSATHSLIGAVMRTDVTFISVGTPSAADGSCDLNQVREAAQTIGRALAAKPDYHVVVVRCTVPPGATLKVVAAEIEATSGRKPGEGFGICFNPEFLREGAAVADFLAPALTVIGASDVRARAAVESIYRAIDPNAVFTSIEAAEMAKYASNAWHAAKAAFANEIGRLCKGMDIDSHEVMDIFVKDSKLNLSSAYLAPGFAYGGSCLPKDVRALAHLGGEMGLDLPLIGSLGASNQAQVDFALKLLAPHAGKHIGLLGLTFKPGTDDLRGSPLAALAAVLLTKGERLSVYDPNVRACPRVRSQLNALAAANPELAPFTDAFDRIQADSLAAMMTSCGVVVVGHATAEFRRALSTLGPNTVIIDLARSLGRRRSGPGYEGIAW